MKPIIGVLPLVDENLKSYWMLPGYFKGIEITGGIPVMLPLNNDEDCINQMIELCDGFLFTGGHDISPSLYGETVMNSSVVCCTERDTMETILFKKAVALDKPILGICRGIQFINAVLGGTLYQDIPAQYPTIVEHHQSPPYNIPVHSVEILEDSPLYNLLKIKTMRVNSYHHQAIKRLAPSLKTAAVSEDGLIEAVYMPEKRFVWGVQFHPEFSFEKDINNRKIFECFISSCIES